MASSTVTYDASEVARHTLKVEVNISGVNRLYLKLRVVKILVWCIERLGLTVEIVERSRDERD